MQTKMFQNRKKQAGAELCQAQAQVGLTAEAELILMFSSMELHMFYRFQANKVIFQ